MGAHIHDGIQILIGVLILLYGRRLFWLFVGGVGFMVALTLAEPLLIGQPEWAILVIGLAGGLLGALCAIAFERVAVAAAGFLAGGAIGIRVAHAAGFAAGPLIVLVILVGGVVGALLVTTFFDWALIVLSSTVGASLVVDCLSIRAVHARLLLPLLLILGVVVQARQLGRHR